MKKVKWIGICFLFVLIILTGCLSPQKSIVEPEGVVEHNESNANKGLRGNDSINVKVVEHNESNANCRCYCQTSLVEPAAVVEKPRYGFYFFYSSACPGCEVVEPHVNYTIHTYAIDEVYYVDVNERDNLEFFKSSVRKANLTSGRLTYDMPFVLLTKEHRNKTFAVPLQGKTEIADRLENEVRGVSGLPQKPANHSKDFSFNITGCPSCHDFTITYEEVAETIPRYCFHCHEKRNVAMPTRYRYGCGPCCHAVEVPGENNEEG